MWVEFPPTFTKSKLMEFKRSEQHSFNAEMIISKVFTELRNKTNRNLSSRLMQKTTQKVQSFFGAGQLKIECRFNPIMCVASTVFCLKMLYIDVLAF